MHIALALEWKEQFEVMRKKSHVSITKLMNVDTNPHQDSVCFNVCVLTSVFFGSRIVCLNNEEEKEL